MFNEIVFKRGLEIERRREIGDKVEEAEEKTQGREEEEEEGRE